MTIKVNPEGALIPKELLGGAEQIEVFARPGNQLVIQFEADPRRNEGANGSGSTLESSGSDRDDGVEAKTDPIWRWGQHPVDGLEPDASVNLDKYRYGAGM